MLTEIILQVWEFDPGSCCYDSGVGPAGYFNVRIYNSYLPAETNEYPMYVLIVKTRAGNRS